MAVVFLGVGSNINPEANLTQCIRQLSLRVKIRAISSVYRTQPEGGREQPPYLNCVVEAVTALSPAELKLGVLRRIESELGRTRGPDPYASRTCDLDLLLYEGMNLHTEEVTVPDPHLAERPYLACAVLELAPDMVLPGDLPLAKAPAAASPHGLAPLPEMTARLRKEFLYGR